MSTHILVATDFSSDADGALNAAIEVARRDGGRIELLHVFPSGSIVLPPPLDVLTLPPGKANLAFIDEGLALRAARVRDVGVPVETHVRNGAPAQEIVAAARELHVDLIVVGSHGTSGVADILIGSVAARVVRHAPCPILVIPRSPRSPG
jgi:nucleotide-binding universal stress UspA family protein